MKNNRLTYIKNILFPCVGLSVVAGILTGCAIVLFKFVTSHVIHFSEWIYATVRANPVYLPLLLVGAAFIGILVAAILKYEPSCQGGGIPTSIGILRGLITFRWLRNLISVFLSATMTYLVAVPLGTEGPSVQMGTAIGRGTVLALARKNPAWDRYIMTGGACAGFATATGAPLTGIFFAFEDAHRRFSPMIFITAASAVVSAIATAGLLGGFLGVHSALFDLTVTSVLPPRFVWIALLCGVVCGVAAIAFGELYRQFGGFVSKRLKKTPLPIKIPIIFLSVALIGFACGEMIGTGHGLIESLLEGHGIWYLLLLYLAVRMILLVVATNTGVTGGLFIPSLAFGALTGALFGYAMIAAGLLPRQHFVLMITLGMAAFLSASSRTPITAIAFSIEALGGITNLLPMIGGITVAYLVIEVFGMPSFTESVVIKRAEREIAGKVPSIVDISVTVQSGSFAVEKEIRDILWPPMCNVLSITKGAAHASGGSACILPGDVLNLHYLTYNEKEAQRQLEAIVGPQEHTTFQTHTADENYEVPQI